MTKSNKVVLLGACSVLFCLVTMDAGWAEPVPTSESMTEGLLPADHNDEKIKTMAPHRKPRHKNPVIDLQIPFELNQYQISPNAVPYLQNLGKSLSSEALKGYVFELQGHTCSKGDEKHNQWLSEKRAASVKEYLVSFFRLSPDQIKTTGYGERTPVADNETEEGRKKNRRVTVINTLTPFKVTSKRPFLKTEAKFLRGKERRDIHPGQTLTSRDNYYLSFIPDQACHVYVFQMDSHDVLTKLFPNPEFSGKSNPVSAGNLYRVPEGINDWIFLDENKGEEEIVMIAAEQPLDDPEMVCRMLIEKNSPEPKVESVKIGTMGPKGIRVGKVVTSRTPKKFSGESTANIDVDRLFTWRLRFSNQ